MKFTKLIALTPLFLGGLAYGFEAGEFSLTGFIQQEASSASNQASPTIPCYGDSRGVLAYPGCGASSETVGQASSTTNLTQGTLKWAHELDNGIKLDAMLTARWRNGNNDIVGQDFYDKNIGLDDPGIGAFRFGTQLARSWSRQDGFSYPIGLSGAWSETGAGFSVLPQSLRFTSEAFEIGSGKIVLEATYATNNRFNTYSTTLPTQSPTPTLWEVFAQYSDSNNLIELIFDVANGAAQSAWGKNPLVGSANIPVITSPSNVYGDTPRQSLISLNGNHWFTPSWMLTWGVRHSYWSGSALMCDYSVSVGGCIYQGGFNVSPAVSSSGAAYNPGWGANVNDFMLGLTYVDGLWSYSAGAVYLGKAQTDNPANFGQNNSALISNLGVYRKMPEIMKDLSFYGGLGAVQFDQLGPAPMSLNSNTAVTGVDPRRNTQSWSATLGANLKF